MSTWKKCLTLGLFIPIILAFISCGASSDEQLESPITGTQGAEESEGSPGVSNNKTVDPNGQGEVDIPVNPPPPILFPPLTGSPAVSVPDRHGGDHDDDFCSADADCPIAFICLDNFCRSSGELVSISISVALRASIAIGTELQLIATGTYIDGSTEDLTSSVVWSSSNTAVATVSNAPGSHGLVTAIAVGFTEITATLGLISGNTTLTVTDAVLISIAVTPPDPSISVGNTQQFIATGTFSDGSTEDLTTSVTWASSISGSATISNDAGSNGLATSVSPGSTSISATLEAISGSTTLTTLPTSLYAILDIGTIGSVVHYVVSIDYSDPNNISYVAIGTIAGFADKYFISATLDTFSGKIFVALSDYDSATSVDNIYLYSVTFPDLLTVIPFFIGAAVYVNLNPQVTYDVGNNLFYYAINNDPSGYDYKVNTIDSSGAITVTNINTSNLQNSGNGLQIYNNFIYATYRPGNSFTVDFAGINDNTTGAISSPITPQPPGQLWSVFDVNGVLWGTTQFAASSLPSYSLYKLQCTVGGLPASDPFPSELVGTMPTTFENNFIANITLFTPAL